MSWDVDEKEFYETFAEITQDRGLEEAKRWAWSALHWTQKELRERDKENHELRKNSDLYTENLPKPHEAGKPSELAQRVTEAFRSSAADAVAVNLARGNTVVGEVNGEWIEKKEQELMDITDNPVIHLCDKPKNRMALYERDGARREEKE